MADRKFSTPGVPVVLITGCSSGIGLMCAQHFARAGFRVYASMRDPAHGAGVREQADREGWLLATPALDVGDQASVDRAVSGLLVETSGRLDVVVNNAGYFLMGPIETTSPDELSAQLDTNILGALRVIRAALPAMRARKSGTIVNVSSVLGRTVLPVAGPYQVSKWGLEALAEALRYEVAEFGIRVVLVEPGPFETPIHANERTTVESRNVDSPYRALIAAYHYLSGKARRGDPAQVAHVILRAATTRRPRLRWPVGRYAWLSCVCRPMLPDRIYEFFVRRALRVRNR